MEPKERDRKPWASITEKHLQRQQRLRGIAAVEVDGVLPFCEASPGQYLEYLAGSFDEPEEKEELLARLARRPSLIRDYLDKLRRSKSHEWEIAAHCGLQAFGFSADEARRWIGSDPDLDLAGILRRETAKQSP